MIDGVFNTSGKIPTDSHFWNQNSDVFMTAEGITAGFSKVLGEQVYLAPKTPQTAFYSAFAGKPLKAGSAWMERAIAKTVAKKFKPKATANDDLAFYDSEGIQKTFEFDYAGWRPVTLPSDFETMLMNVEEGGIGQLNSTLVDNVYTDYLRDMESATQKKVISTTKSAETIEYQSAMDIFMGIQEISADMQGSEKHFNELTNTENGKIYTNSEKVLCFIPLKTYNYMMTARSNLPSPDQIITNVEFIPTADSLATPITKTEFEAGVTAGTWSSSAKPFSATKTGKDVLAKPDIYMCSAKKCEIRPAIGSYKVNLTKNGAGDFTNQHLLWKCAIGVKPWENGVRIYLDERTEGE